MITTAFQPGDRVWLRVEPGGTEQDGAATVVQSSDAVIRLKLDRLVGITQACPWEVSALPQPRVQDMAAFEAEALREQAYRVGVHQALARARRLLERADDLADARRLLAGMEQAARVLRYEEGSPLARSLLLDAIEEKARHPEAETV
jgi:hypothetical protein